MPPPGLLSPGRASTCLRAKSATFETKYAFFAFVYSIDLFLGALPLWPTKLSSEYQLDRKDPLRHYTLDIVRWLSKSDNMANKPSTGKEKGTFFRSGKDVVKLLHACERSNTIFTEYLGALTTRGGNCHFKMMFVFISKRGKTTYSEQIDLFYIIPACRS
jgi:hypothetical protein